MHTPHAKKKSCIHHYGLIGGQVRGWGTDHAYSLYIKGWGDRVIDGNENLALKGL